MSAVEWDASFTGEQSTALKRVIDQCLKVLAEAADAPQSATDNTNSSGVTESGESQRDRQEH